MFRKLQWKLTLLHTLLLVAVLAATNLTVYFLLQAFNVTQIANEADAMLGSLEASAWMDESETETVPQTIDVATPEPAGEGARPDGKDAEPDGEDAAPSAESGSGQNHETPSPASDGEATKDHESTDDSDGKEDKKAGSVDDSASAPVESGTPHESGPSDDSDGSDGGEARESKASLADARLWSVGPTVLGSAVLGTVTPLSLAGSGMERDAAPRYAQAGAVSSSSPTTPGPGDTASTGDVRSLHVPAVLKQFTFYLVFDLEGNLTAHNVGNLRTLNSLMALAPDIRPQARPEVRDLPDGPLSRVLLVRRSIEIDGIPYGSYLVGRDLSLVTETMANLRRILLFGFLAGMLVSLLIGYLLAGRAIRPIREAYEAKQRFLADASHELRTPISVVLLSAESLERALQPGQEEARSDLDDIRAETFRMRDLVERLLFLARSDSRRHPAGKDRVEVGAMLAEIGESLDVLAKARQITLEQRISPDLACRGDRKMLASLFSVLMENAIKYNREAGRVIVEGTRIRLKKREWVEIRVSDTGIGIPAAELARIFERFYRADPARSQKVGGHGLGLAIAREIAEAHGGTIGVVSQPEIGTTFTVRLPAAEPPPLA